MFTQDGTPEAAKAPRISWLQDQDIHTQNATSFAQPRISKIPGSGPWRMNESLASSFVWVSQNLLMSMLGFFLHSQILV